MNILHLEASVGWGGQEIRILKEAEGMRARGHNIIIVVAKGGGLVKEAKKSGFQVYEINFRKIYWLSSFFKLIKIIKNHSIDIVNTHSSLDAWLGGIVCKCLKIPVVRTRHLSAYIRGGLNGIVLYGKLADKVVTTCEDMVSYICNLSKKTKDHCISIPTGVDATKIVYKNQDVEDFRKGLKIEKDDFLIGLVCFMRSWKGIYDFMEAIKLLKNEKNLQWVIIGGGHSESYMLKAKEMGLNNLHFTGHLENPFSAIGALDVFSLLSTANEGVSQASLQAAFLQKPLITTPTGGLKEVCIDNLTGIQVPIFSPNKVAEAVLKLKNDRALCLKLGSNGKKLVDEHFTLPAMLNKMEKIYQSVLK
ncbi:MAG: glycosyltransferase family 4 protein [Chlamydiae bacterium]|nr:glycosyltransferase family 4 protein [Chlamydiota bacterium]